MNIYRLIHNEEAYKLRDHPKEGCLFHNSLPYFTAFDSIPAALIESHIFREYHLLPSCLRLVEYNVAEEASFREYTSETLIRYNNDNVLPSLTQSAYLCLAGEVAAIASFPSIHYKNMQNFLINPLHPHFDKIELSRIYKC